MHSTYVKLNGADRPIPTSLALMFGTAMRIGEWLGQHEIAYSISVYDWDEVRIDFHRAADQVLFVLNFTGHPDLTVLGEGEDSASRNAREDAARQAASLAEEKARREARLHRRALRAIRRLVGKGA